MSRPIEELHGAVLLQVADGVARITINRPDQRNALNAAVVAGLRDGIARAASDQTCAVAIITGAGDRAFCAGGDLTGADMGGGAAAAHDARSQLAELVVDMQHSRLPIIGRVNGAALGGGFGLMLACDLVVASDSASIGMPEVDLGLWPFLVSALVRRHVGPKLSLELMLTGRKMAAREAMDLGFVNLVTPPAELEAAVDDLAARIGAKSGSTVALGKRSFYESQDMALREAFAYLGGMLTLCLQTEDAAEGLSAFMQKRAPQWRGR